MSNATTKPKHTTVNTKPNDGMKNAKRWESLLNALLERSFTHRLPTTFDDNYEPLVRGFHDLGCR